MRLAFYTTSIGDQGSGTPGTRFSHVKTSLLTHRTRYSDLIAYQKRQDLEYVKIEEFSS